MCPCGLCDCGVRCTRAAAGPGGEQGHRHSAGRPHWYIGYASLPPTSDRGARVLSRRRFTLLFQCQWILVFARDRSRMTIDVLVRARGAVTKKRQNEIRNIPYLLFICNLESSVLYRPAPPPARPVLFAKPPSAPGSPWPSSRLNHPYRRGRGRPSLWKAITQIGSRVQSRIQ